MSLRIFPAVCRRKKELLRFFMTGSAALLIRGKACLEVRAAALSALMNRRAGRLFRDSPLPHRPYASSSLKRKLRVLHPGTGRA